ELARGQCLVAGFGQGDVGDRANAHVLLFAVHDEAKDPRTGRAVTTDLQIQSALLLVTVPAIRRALNEKISELHGIHSYIHREKGSLTKSIQNVWNSFNRG